MELTLKDYYHVSRVLNIKLRGLLPFIRLHSNYSYYVLRLEFFRSLLSILDQAGFIYFELELLIIRGFIFGIIPLSFPELTKWKRFRCFYFELSRVVSSLSGFMINNFFSLYYSVSYNLGWRSRINCFYLFIRNVWKSS